MVNEFVVSFHSSGTLLIHRSKLSLSIVFLALRHPW